MINTVQFYQPKKKLQISDHIFQTSVNGLFYIKIKKNHDLRGFFSEIINFSELEKIIRQPFQVKQANLSYSKTKVVRGMHAEGWNKLATVLSGQAFCALADIRPQSKTYQQVEYFQLGFDPQLDKNAALFISQGIANSICAVKGPVSYLYLVDKLYCERDPKDDLAVSIFDPDLNIQWPFKRSQLIYSQRDKKAMKLKELYPK